MIYKLFGESWGYPPSDTPPRDTLTAAYFCVAPCTKIVDSNAELDAAMKHIRRQLSDRILQIRAARKSFDPLLKSMASLPPRGYPTQKRAASADATSHSPHKKAEVGGSKLENFFKLRSTGDAIAEIAALDIPDVATDVRSTYLRLQMKRDTHAEDKDFNIVKDALSKLRGYVNQNELHKMITDPKNTSKTVRQLTTEPPNTSKTVRQHFKEKFFATLHFSFSPSSVEAGAAQQAEGKRYEVHHSHEWRTYYAKLLILAQARRWLSATKLLHPIEDSPPTPKTNFQLAAAIKKPNSAQYAPFGCDFEDPDVYSPIISRLFIYAEIHNCNDHDFGTFSTPHRMMPYTYRQSPQRDYEMLGWPYPPRFKTHHPYMLCGDDPPRIKIDWKFHF